MHTWVLIATVAVVYSLGTIRLASSELRVPMRAERIGRPYTYGFYDAEPDGTGHEQRWARRRAAVLLDRSTPWLELTLRVNHLDVESRPVQAKAWLDGRLIVDTYFNTTEPVVRRVFTPENRRKVLLETWVSRVVHPRDFNVADDRQLGLLVRWTFLDHAPHASLDKPRGLSDR
jgi:hypothetical protein